MRQRQAFDASLQRDGALETGTARQKSRRGADRSAPRRHSFAGSGLFATDPRDSHRGESRKLSGVTTGNSITRGSCQVPMAKP